MFNPNKAVTYNSLDQPDYVPAPERNPIGYSTGARPAKRGMSVKAWLTLSLLSVGTAAIVVWGLAAWLQSEYTTNDTFSALVRAGLYGVAVCVFIFIGGALLLLLFALFGVAARAGLVRLPGDMPAHAANVARMGSRETLAAVDAHFEVQRTLAANSGFRNVTSYSPSINHGPAGRGDTSDAPAPPALPSDSAMPQAQWVEALNESPHLLIYGPSKAGKSTIAQAYVATFGACEYVVIDPMPNKPNESKWGGIDFITLDSGAGDEFASIIVALDRITAEDDRRRRTMQTDTFAPLIIIIDEVLGLVDALGTVKNAEGKNEPRMANFIRKMGYSARHRNIKIILIGQGKNLADLSLKSGTARNNYALLRAERNAATNERAAYIGTDSGEQAIIIQQVPALAAAATQAAHVWLTHQAILLNVLLESVPVHADEKPGFQVETSAAYQYSVDGVQPIPTPDTGGTALPEDDEAVMLRNLLQQYSKNKVAQLLGGSKSTAFGRINRAMGELAAVEQR